MAVSQSLTLSQVSQNSANNTSNVRILWTSTQNGDSHNDFTKTAYYYVSVNGGAETKYSVSYTLPQNTTKTIVDTTVTVNHNDEGKCSVKVRTWMSTDISAGVVELSKSLTLTDIPRAASISASNADIGSASVISVKPTSASYTHSIAYQFGSLSGYITADGSVSASEVKHTATSILFVVPTDFYGEIPNDPSKKCVLTCRTYSGSTVIGQNTCEFLAKASEEECRPDVSGTVTDTNEDAIALTGNPDTLIRYVSTAHCEISVTVKNEASISAKKINGITIESDKTYHDINKVDTGSFEFYAIDSRKYPNTYSVTKTLIPYVILTCNASATRTDPTSGNAVLEIKGNYYNGSFGSQDNTLTLTYSVDGKEYIPITPEIQGDKYSASVTITGLDYQASHTIYVIAADKVGDVPETVTVGKGIPVFDWGENDFAFHVPVSFQAGVAGNALFDKIYPVGSVYMSVNSTSPATLFGGTWERIQDRFLLAAGTSYAAGATGGEASHTLSTSEIPSHTHTFTGTAASHTHDTFLRDANATSSANYRYLVDTWGTGATALGWTMSLSTASGKNRMLTGSATHTPSGTNANTGGGASHNNMPPYLAVYIWKRTA